MTISTLLYLLGTAIVWAGLRRGGSTDDPIFQGPVLGWILPGGGGAEGS